MKKVLLTITFTTLLLSLFIFRFNLLSFYHEYLKGDIIDIGGFGKEKIYDLKTDDNGNIYLLSTTVKEDSFTDRFQFSEYILISKLSSDQKVIWSYTIDHFGDTELDINTINLTPSDLTLLDNGSIAFLSTYHFDTANYSHLTILNPDTNTHNSHHINDEEKVGVSLTYKANQLTLFYLPYRLQDNTQEYYYETFDDTFNLIHSNTIETINYNYIEDSFYIGGILHTLVKNKDNIYRVDKIDVNSETLLFNPIEAEHIFYSINQNKIILSSIKETDNLWDNESLDIIGYDFDSQEELAEITLSLENIDNRLYGIFLTSDDSIYVYGAITAPTHINASYEVFSSGGEYLDTYHSNIGGIDTIKDMYQNGDDIYAIISAKRISDTLYFGSNPTYDQFIRTFNE
jgi:hypothetical protein